MQKFREKIFQEVVKHRAFQDLKYGKANSTNTLAEWQCILNEECGEVAKEINDIRLGVGTHEQLREELIQSIAVCFAMLESNHLKHITPNE